MSKLYKRDKQSGIYYLRYREQPSGKFKWISLRTKNREYAERKRRRIDRALRMHKLLQVESLPVALSFDQLKEHYETWAQIQRAEGTIYLTTLAIDKFTAQTGLTHVAQVKGYHIETFKAKELSRETGKEDKKKKSAREA